MKTRTRSEWTAALCTVAAVTLVATGCSGDRGGGGQGHSSASGSAGRAACSTIATPGFPGVDRCDVESVMVAAAQRIFSFNPATESSTADSFWAAAPLLTADYLAQVGVSAAMLAPVTAGDWLRWKAERAQVHAVATVASDEHPTPQTRVVAVTQRVKGPSGEVLERDLPQLVLYMAVSRSADGDPYGVSQIAVR